MYQIIFLVLISLPLFESACPMGAVPGLSNGTCYQVFTTPTAWTTAESNCAKLGGHLASIANGFENNFIAHLNLTAYYAIAVGGTTEKSTPNWTWTDNSPFKFTNWLKGRLER